MNLLTQQVIFIKVVSELDLDSNISSEFAVTIKHC